MRVLLLTGMKQVRRDMKFTQQIVAILLIVSGGTASTPYPASQQVSLDRLLSGHADSVVVAGDIYLPISEFLIPLPDSLGPSDFQYAFAEPTIVGSVPRSQAEWEPTAADEQYRRMIQSHANREMLGNRPVVVHGVLSVDGARYLRLTVSPRTVDHDGVVREYSSVFLSLGDEPLTAACLLAPDSIVGAADSHQAASPASSGSSSPYLIVCAAAHVGVLEQLAVYRRATGYDSRIETIEAITSAMPGRDDAERLRNYLQEYHAGGGRYVLLAGDEIMIPTRYAYQYDASAVPSPDLMIPTDLYYADLTGEWDSDGDGIWGERTEDAPDLNPELLIGRLPLADSAEFANYIENLITYEAHPGNGDFGYLTRTLFFSSDQMRDYYGGQHNVIARSFPPTFEIDTTTAVEQSAGDDPAPSNLSPAKLGTSMGAGFGIINVIAHGRNDGFVVRSANYNDWPKQYLLTDAGESGHGEFDDLLLPGKPAFYISLACDNGAYDKDAPPFTGSQSMVQHLLGTVDGAVGMVANTRWGWVGTSYLLHQTFFDSLMAHPDRPAVLAMHDAARTYWYYRDLVYGQNFFGDPALRVYTRKPVELTATATRAATQLTVVVTDPSGAVAGADITILDNNGVLIDRGVTDGEGQFTTSSIDGEGLYTVTAMALGHTVSLIESQPSIITDVGDDLTSLPASYSLAQNYPNPFNPTTTIAYELPHESHVSITVFNVLGQRVSTLVDEVQPAGSYTTEWAAAESGRELASGVYFYRIEADGFNAVRKMMLVR